MEKVYYLGSSEGQILYYPNKDIIYMLDFRKDEKRKERLWIIPLVFIYCLLSPILNPYLYSVVSFIGRLLAPFFIDVKYPILSHGLVILCWSCILYKFIYKRSVQKTVKKIANKKYIYEADKYLKRKVLFDTFAGLFGIISLYIITTPVGLYVIYNVDVYIAFIAFYDMLLPAAIIYGNFKGRFILLKKL